MFGGRIGLILLIVFWLWGISFLGICHIHQISSVARIIWAAWFVLGCIVAVVNGVDQWLREQRSLPGIDPE